MKRRREKGCGGHEERGGDRAEKGVRLQPVHVPRHEADNKSHRPGPQPVARRSAEDGAEARRREKAAEVIDRRAVAAAGSRRLPEPARRLWNVRRFGADAAAERVEALHRVEIVSVEAHAAHDHQGLSARALKTEHHTVRDDKRLTLHTVGAEHALHRFFYAEGLRAADGKLIADLCRQIR